MKERMQKTLSRFNGCPQRDRSETGRYVGVQTFMWMCEANIVEVPSLCDERQMPTHGAPKIQSQDEVNAQITDKSQQRMGIRREKAKAERIHTRVGRLLSPCQYEASIA